MDAPAFVLLFTVGGAVAVLIWSLTLRHKRQELRHQERMAAIEKGAELPAEPSEMPPAPWSPRVYLLRGLIWLFTGIGLSIFLLGLSTTIRPRIDTYEDRLFRAQSLRHEGATEEEIKTYLNRQDPRESGRFPEGFALLGLIPIGVGAAYLIYYRGEQRRPA